MPYPSSATNSPLRPYSPCLKPTRSIHTTSTGKRILKCVSITPQCEYHTRIQEFKSTFVYFFALSSAFACASCSSKFLIYSIALSTVIAFEIPSVSPGNIAPSWSIALFMRLRRACSATLWLVRRDSIPLDNSLGYERPSWLWLPSRIFW